MTDYSIINDIASIKSVSSPIMAMGVGGAGGNAIKHMWEMGIEGVNLAACNTDQDDLDKLKIPEDNRILLGNDGLGAGNNAQVGAEKATESLDAVRNLFAARKTKMLFLAAGMGGGTGTGAAPVIAELAHELDILTVAIVTTPPIDEGPLRTEQAKRGIEQLRKYVDSLIILSNDAINELYGDLSLENSFDRANDVVAFAAKGIAEIVTHKNNLVNVDFADVCTVMRGSGCAIMGVATESGEDRAEKVIDRIITSPLFGNASIAGARDVLINISVASSDALTAGEARRVRNRVQHHAKSEDENGNVKYTNIIWGMSVKPYLGENDMEVIVVATGFSADLYAQQVFKAPEIEAPEVEVEAKPETNTFKHDIATPAPVSNAIRRPTYNFDDIEELKRTPAWKAHGITLTQAVAPKSPSAQKPAEDTNVPSLF